jgi:TonB family protein
MRRIPVVLVAFVCLLNSISAQSGLPAPDQALIVAVRSSRRATPQGDYLLELASGTRIAVPAGDMHDAATVLVRQVVSTQVWQPAAAARLFVIYVQRLTVIGKSHVDVTLHSGVVVRVRTNDIGDPRLTFLRTALAEARELEIAGRGGAQRAYLSEVSTRVRQNWHPGEGAPDRPVRVKFVVQNDGRITDIQIVESGGDVLDLAATRALTLTGQLPPPSREFNGKLTIDLTFSVR